jgi:glycine oxidase
VNHCEVGIAGGGIIGLSAALELAAAGRQVTVFERGCAMAESSWAAAGMLAAGDPENPAALQPLADLSARLYPQFLADVERLSGEHVPIRTTRAIQGARRLPEGHRELNAAELAASAPGLEAGDLRFFSLDEPSLDPRDLARALPLAVRAAGVTLLENTAVRTVSAQAGGARIETDSGAWIAEKMIHCSGAWAAELTGVPIVPRKGQMVVVEERGAKRLEGVLRTPEIYLVPRGLEPRGDSRIAIGATVEEAGFDKQVHSETTARLLDMATALWPRVGTMRVVDAWAGLRPATADNLPVIDECGKGCWMAAGHFRNGILLAPGTARLLREMISGEPLSIDLEPFRCGRFAASSLHSQ